MIKGKKIDFRKTIKEKILLSYEEKELVLLKNKQIISKHINPKNIIEVKENKRVTIIDPRNHKYHKTDIKKRIV